MALSPALNGREFSGAARPLDRVLRRFPAAWPRKLGATCGAPGASAFAPGISEQSDSNAVTGGSLARNAAMADLCQGRTRAARSVLRHESGLSKRIMSVVAARRIRPPRFSLNALIYAQIACV